MDREIVWSALAAADLATIVEHIFRDSEFYAAAVARDLVAAADQNICYFHSFSVAAFCPAILPATKHSVILPASK